MLHITCRVGCLVGNREKTSGGVLCIIQVSHFDDWVLSFEEEVPLRIAGCNATRDLGEEWGRQWFYCSGVHNSDFSARQLDRFGAKLGARVREAKHSHRLCGVVWAGDFSLLPPHGQDNSCMATPDRNMVLKSSRVAPLVPSQRPLQGNGN